MSSVLDYIDIRDTLVTFLNAVNTTTAGYDLSTGLDTRIVKIESRDLLNYPARSSDFPYIAAKLNSKSGETLVTNKATNASRIVEFYLQLDCVYEEFGDADTDLGKLVRNIETNIRDNITLSAYASGKSRVNYMIPDSVAFHSYDVADSAFNRSASIQVLFNCYISI